MGMRNDFAVFILTHGRPDNVITINTLKKHGYKGIIYLIVDNEDKTIDQYYNNFGHDNVIVFDKKAMADKIDEGNNFNERRTITHARNACFEIAEKKDIKYFIQLDDDYKSFEWRHKSPCGTKLLVKKVKDINTVFMYYLEFFKNTECLSVAMAQGGDFVGGVNNKYAIKRPMIRKCMNSFICSTERKFHFIGSMNEDVNTYTTLGSRGHLFATLPFVILTQKQTQSQKGGITDMYLKFGTYAKSFSTVTMMPSSVRVTYQVNMGRLHHSISWANTVPMILADNKKKFK